MLPSKDLVCFLFLWIFVTNVKCQDIEEMSKTLDEILVNTRSFRRPRNHEDSSLIWQEYEFGTGAGNREVIVTNISLYGFNLPDNIDWKFFQIETSYFICAENSTLFFYKINLDDLSVEHTLSITTEGKILQFKVLNLNTEKTFYENHVNLMVVLLVEIQHSYFLYWYRIFGNTYTLYLTWPVQKQIQDMEFVREEEQHELLLLDNDVHPEEQSLIDIYGFNVDYNKHRIDIWFCRRLFVPKVFDVQICSIYGSSVLAFQGINNIILYKSKNERKSCQFEKFEIIESNELRNFVCFESGYIEYLAIGGKETRLLRFSENEFQNNVETDLHFNDTTDISWITTISLNTYRDESLLLVQFKNLSVIALAWQGLKFKTVALPNQIINNFDLSKIIPIPKVGFVHANVLVCIDVTLSELAHPIHNETESILKTRILLEEVFRKQEVVFDETKARLDQSYFKNAVSGLWNFSKVDASNATIERNVNYGAVKVGSIDLEMEDILINVTSILKKLDKFDTRLNQILLDLQNVTDSRINLSSDIELTGNFLVTGTLYAKNITAAFVNNASTSIAGNNIVNYVSNIVNGQKSFLSINTDNLTVFSLNGVPLQEIVLDTSIKNYNNTDFSKLKRLQINGHLNFSEINNVTWENLMQSVIWKDEPITIPGETIVEGQLIVDEANVKNLNHLRYPEDYVLINDKNSINVTGEKYFANLSTTHLLGIDSINKINIDDFIIVSRQEIIDHEITFENLEIGIFQLDGDITGINISNIEGLLNETARLSSDIIFENLTVMGNIVLQDSIDDRTWSDFDDLLLKTEENALITGNKKFSNRICINSNVTITSGQINNHFFSEFVTLNTDQQFPYLRKISANVTFGNVTFGMIKKLENYITREQNVASATCLNKVLLFIRSCIVDDLSFDTLKQNITQTAFFDKLNQTFEKMYFENLILSTLIADEISPNTINYIDYANLTGRILTISTQQNLTGALIVDNLEIDVLNAEIINGMPLNELQRLLEHAKSLYNDIFNGNAPIRSLRVTGMITASLINDNDIVNVYKKDCMGTVIFKENTSIKHLTVVGFVNGLNLTEFVADAVQKVDRNITFVGHKTLENVTCEFLKARVINGHPIENILDSSKKQILKGPVVINGWVTVLRNFDTTGKIGNVFLCDFINRFKSLENNTYALHGNFYFNEITSITRLNISGLIQRLMFDSLLETLIRKNDENIIISGSKIFKSPITFNSAFTIYGNLNNLDLNRFHKNAIYIDKPFSIDVKVMFKEDVYIQKTLVVKTELQSNTIMDVDMKDLQENVITLNELNYFSERIILDNVTFQASIKVVQVNDLKINMLIPLHTKQLIISHKLNCNNATVKNIQITGHINTYHLEDIFTNTFLIYSNQNISGYIHIQGNVYAYHDFNAHLVNRFNTKQIVSLIANDTLAGNFIFKTPVVLDKSLKIGGLLNGINPINWQGVAIEIVTKQIIWNKQIISGKWKIYGNVHFEENIGGSEFLSGVNVSETSFDLSKENPEIDRIINETYMDLNNIYAFHLDTLKYNAMNQIYKFNTFDYLKIQEFEGDIHDIRTIELDMFDYILVNYDTCRMKLIMYIQNDFQVVDEVSDFGLIDKWIFLNPNHPMYFFTVAKRTCGRSLNNIWKLENNRLMHVSEFDNVSYIMDLHQDQFVSMASENLENASENIQSDILQSLISYKNENKKLNLISNIYPIAFVNQSLIYGLQGRSSNDTYLRNDSTLNFKVGIYEKEEYIYYDEEVSRDYIFLCQNDISQTQILQTIKTRLPKSFLILNFNGLVETLFIFAENNDTIQIYEYKGINGFVQKSEIKIKVDKLYNFKIRKHINLEKKHCLAVIHKNRLTILEAKMYGEKLDL
ncbi:uncharacterized protein LOC114938508 isoform X3 [Nylanderia fulva]|uniref:uncharacterized protein LOC114938508 isoform X3 n=1 Tax=Nylanderia fulva TaxID=613905 RepID=UPI0010FB4FE8|nr:uncharacterized protein LOC114938508 isoform X3 [Nylanderia fulva]